MSNNTSLAIAIGDHREVPPDWMPASQVGPFIAGDPAVVWLEFHGEEHGFQPDTSAYAFGDFIAEKARQFEEKWLQEMAPEAIRVCRSGQEARSADKVRETFELMRRGAPVIAQPALWWAPERVYGVPDLLAHSAWLRERFPGLMSEATSASAASYLGEAGPPGHYLVLDFKFTTQLDQSGKSQDLETYAAQVRIYTYMLGHLQGLMPQHAFLIARDRIDDPLLVPIPSALDAPLDEELAAIRDWFVDIKLNGAQYRPWEDEVVASNLGAGEERWATAKDIIARERTSGRDPGLLYQVGPAAKAALADLGYASLDSLLEPNPADVPLEQCKGIGGKRAIQMRAILQANRSGVALPPPADVVPPQRQFEFFVDFEYFTNVNVEFETQWPALGGQEMIFLIGVGQAHQGEWHYEALMAAAEDQDQEFHLFEDFIDYLAAETGGAFLDASATALYHWSRAEVWQSRRSADRHQLADDHPLRRLPWCDLQKPFLAGPGALPGAWKFGLKGVAKALGDVAPQFSTQWPDELAEGLQAMVMGWHAYQSPDPGGTEEMAQLIQYLEADCQALWNILRWLRVIT